ncbi:MAG: HD domain-containing protein [Romboutsia sp.]|nr:HD domain-containing protein [Romboutsia sp.]
MHLLTSYNIESFLIRDPIYGFIEVPKIFKEIIDHKLFQRLRWISQLPLEQLVYPSAQHSRFEHSLGVMHLSIISAISLINNSWDAFEVAFPKDKNFKDLTDEEQKRNFILAAGLAGLLHDIGHAPFSHTLEEACKYSKINYKYDHEEVGYLLSEFLMTNSTMIDKIFVQKCLSVLNKKLKILNKELTPITMIIRKLIDGPIDVDKGDYIIRDSYHCGTTYGVYDIQRLWRSIVINPNDYTIGVNKKGALEAWTLRFQRFKIYKNVYKHHTRNITDSMLVDIIANSINSLKGKSSKRNDLIPIWNSLEELKEDKNITRFIFWTDNSMLKVISLDNNSINHRIESFLKRDIYKRGFELDLSSYPGALSLAQVNSNNELHISLMELKGKLKKDNNLYFDFLIERDVVAPVFEKEVQLEIKVLDSENSFIPLANYLHISVPQEYEEQIKPSSIFKLYVFIKKGNLDNLDLIKSEITALLETYNHIS